MELRNGCIFNAGFINNQTELCHSDIVNDRSKIKEGNELITTCARTVLTYFDL